MSGHQHAGGDDESESAVVGAGVVLDRGLVTAARDACVGRSIHARVGRGVRPAGVGGGEGGSLSVGRGQAKPAPELVF